MADLKAQSPSLAITVRVLFGRTTSRQLRFEARRNEPLRSDFEVGRRRRSFAGQSPLPFCGAPGVFPHLPKLALVAATVRLGHLMFQTKWWNEAIRMARPQGAVAIARHHHAGSVRANDIKATGL
jgi:hypothetical protein